MGTIGLNEVRELKEKLEKGKGINPKRVGLPTNEKDIAQLSVEQGRKILQSNNKFKNSYFSF